MTVVRKLFRGALIFAMIFPVCGIVDAADAPAPATMFDGLVVAKGSCLRQPKIDCSDVLEFLRKGDYKPIQPTKIIASRDDPEFAALFPTCNLAPTKYSDDLDWDTASKDPFYYEVTSKDRVESQFLPYGPFAIYDIKLHSGKIRRVMKSTGYEGIGLPIGTQHDFAIQLPNHKCSLTYLGSYKDHDTDGVYASLGALVWFKGNAYLATYEAFSPQWRSGGMGLAPVGVAITNHYSVARASVSFSVSDPRDK